MEIYGSNSKITTLNNANVNFVKGKFCDSDSEKIPMQTKCSVCTSPQC